jgi:hypothetical protein
MVLEQVLLDIASRLPRERPWSEISMEEIVAVAGVARTRISVGQPSTGPRDSTTVQSPGADSAQRRAAGADESEHGSTPPGMTRLRGRPRISTGPRTPTAPRDECVINVACGVILPWRPGAREMLVPRLPGACIGPSTVHIGLPALRCGAR